MNVLNTDPAHFNISSGEGAGVATMMTGIGEVLKRGGYSTAAIGKWDVGEMCVARRAAISLIHCEPQRRDSTSWCRYGHTLPHACRARVRAVADLLPSLQLVLDFDRLVQNGPKVQRW